MNLNGIHSTVTFPELSIFMCRENSAYKMHVTGSGSGSLKTASKRTFPWLGKLIYSSLASVRCQVKSYYVENFVNISSAII